MIGINTGVFKSRARHLFVIGLLCCASLSFSATDRVTRIYLLKHTEVAVVVQALNIEIRDENKTRVIGGEGKRLVITDTADQQDAIALLLPILDQPMKETDPDKIVMRMVMNVSHYMREQKMAARQPAPGTASSPQVPGNTPGASSTPNIAGGVKSFDTFKSATPYKSIYASDDAKLLKKPRLIFDEPALPSLSALELKGIFRASADSSLALMSYAGMNYTARDGGLFESNHKRVKNVSSRILKDRVILVGPDRIEREIKFKSTL